MKKMAFVDLSNFHDWPMGGMLEYELNILNELVKEYDIDIWGVSIDGIKPKPITINGRLYPINIFTNVVTHKRIIPNYWRGLFIKDKKINIKGKYDYIYAHTGSCLVGISTFEDKAKLIYHQHGLNYMSDHSLMSLIQRPLLNKAQEKADLVFVVSDHASVTKYEKEMKRKHRIHAKYVSVKSPIQIERFDENQEFKKIQGTKVPNRFIYTGRLSRYKNAKLLVDAFNKYVKNVDKEASLDIVGSGEEELDIKNLINKYNLKDRVILHGAVSHNEIYKLLQNASIFLTASSGEGVSVSVAEAYAAGLPVVCFEVPGLSKQVIDMKTGKIAKKHTVDGFFDAMKYVVQNYNYLAKNCIAESKEYDAKNLVQSITTNISSL